MRKLRKFSSLTDYNNYKSSNDYITPNVCLVSSPHKVMYSSSSGSEIIITRLPQGYEELKYIQNNGAAAFKILFNLKNLSYGIPGFDFDFYLPTNDPYTSNFTIFGVYASSGYTDWRVYRRNNNLSTDAGEIGLNIVKSGGSSTWYNLHYNFNGNPYIMQTTSVRNLNVTGFDKNQFTTNDHRYRYDYGQYIGIGNLWRGDNNGFETRIYTQYYCIGYLALYLGTSKQYEFIPAKRLSDNKIGMYDLVNNVFHSSETGTEFIAGPAIN